MTAVSRSRTLVLAAAVLAAAPLRAQAGSDSRTITLAAGTTLFDSGLLDSIVPAFEQQTGARVRIVPCGTAQCLRLGERGDADVLITHAPAAESAFVRAGHAARRQVVAWNYFTIAGPAADPARVRHAPSAAAGLRAIADHSAAFVSRGDFSGTHQRELALWRQAGGRPDWPGYLESGQGMGATLRIAGERRAYVLCDRATFLATRADAALVMLRGREPALLNPYHVLEPVRAGRTAARVALARAFAEWLVSAQAQDRIARFGAGRFPEPLFIPARGREPLP